MQKPIELNLVTCIWRSVESNTYLRNSLSEYMEVTKLAVVMVLGSIGPLAHWHSWRISFGIAWQCTWSLWSVWRCKFFIPLSTFHTMMLMTIGLLRRNVFVIPNKCLLLTSRNSIALLFLLWTLLLEAVTSSCAVYS